MEVKTTITNITHDDLVNLFSTATYGSYYLDCGVPKGFYKGTELEDENDCREDKWAKVLLAGKHIYVYDYYAEDADEFYGNLPHHWSANRECMIYELTLDDIKKAVEKLSCAGTHEKKWVQDWINEGNDFDLIEADALMQCIVFGKYIYG